jgi:16S rRNA (guanine966-N2)-methyltransferase
MSEKIRGAIYNMLGDIHGLSFFDPFAGSGALAYEAISRGAASVLATELDQGAYTTIRENIRQLDLSKQVTALRKDAKSWSRTHKDTQFDVVLCDPPYDDVRYTLLIQLAQHTKPGGLIVYSLPPDHGFKLDPNTFKVEVEKLYGDATLVFYRRIS